MDACFHIQTLDVGAIFVNVLAVLTALKFGLFTVVAFG